MMFRIGSVLIVLVFVSMVHARQTGCDGTKKDLVIILDSSTSVRPDDFEKMLSFITDIVSVADIDSGNIRVGVVTYSTNSHIQFHLNSYNSKLEIVDAVANIPHLFGSTNTADVLKTMHSEMFTEGNGDRPGADNIGILITDGISNINSRRTIPEAEAAHNKNIDISVIAVGLDDLREVDKIASKPLNRYLVSIPDFDSLSAFKYHILSLLC